MKTIISASRRTDIPAFYLRWLSYHIERGSVSVRNPVFKQKHYTVSLQPEDVHSIVLWSKDFSTFLRSRLARDDRYRWYFNFSLVACPEWEQAVPPLAMRLHQVDEICRRWSAQAVNWRFDPIVFWDEGRRHNLDSFLPIADHMAQHGVGRCTVSFVTWYKKVNRRRQSQALCGHDPPLSQKLEIVAWMEAALRERDIQLASCCNDDLLAVEGVKQGQCVPGPLLEELAGERCTQARDGSQRPGCGCTKSADIGSYEMTCLHGCTYCYAKPHLFAGVKA